MSDASTSSNQYNEGVRDLVGEMLYEFGWRPVNDAQWSGLAQGLPKLAELLQRHVSSSAVETSGDAIYENTDELVRDAARYRFLRQPNNAIVYAKDRNAWGEGTSGHVAYDTPEKLDVAVDAARGAVEPT